MNYSKCFTRKLTLFLFVVLLISGVSVAAGSADQSLSVRGGVIVFNRPDFDTVTLVEFPFALTRSQFDFFRPDTTASTFFTRIFAQVNLYGADGLPVDSANTYFSAAVADSSEAFRPDYSLFNSLVLIVRPGTYSARLNVIDVVSKREGEWFYEHVNVEPPVKDRLSMGGKCLAYNIAYVGDAAASVRGVPKNGYDVLCNPTSVFSTSDTVAFLYGEIYNLKFGHNSGSEFLVNTVALDDSGRVFRQLGSRTHQKAGKSAVLAESFSIREWSPGSYVVQITVADRESGQEISQDYPLSIVTPAPLQLAASADLAVNNDPCASLDLETQKHLIDYLLSPQERSMMNSLLPEGQMKYIERYWQERDPDVTTAILENRQTMYERYLFANNTFSIEEGRVDGWSTDRGRVLMIYGHPDKLEDYVHPSQDYPCQLWWYYSIKDGAVFVFRDTRGFGDYKLVHSNLPGELFNSDWDAALKAGPLRLDE
jgi:GWxTD domain-containing protein